MSFQKSACDIHLNPERDGTTSLVAICNNDEGTGLTSEIPLDDFLGNEDGKIDSCPVNRIGNGSYAF